MQKLQTKRELSLPVKEQPVTLISGITFAQVPYWFPFYNYRDLKLDLLLPFGRSNGKRPCSYGSAAAVSSPWSAPPISPGCPGSRRKAM